VHKTGWTVERTAGLLFLTIGCLLFLALKSSDLVQKGPQKPRYAMYVTGGAFTMLGGVILYQSVHWRWIGMRLCMIHRRSKPPKQHRAATIRERTPPLRHIPSLGDGFVPPPASRSAPGHWQDLPKPINPEWTRLFQQVADMRSREEDPGRKAALRDIEARLQGMPNRKPGTARYWHSKARGIARREEAG